MSDEKVDAFHVETHTCQIGWIVTQTLEFFNSVVAAHIPVYGFSLG